MKLAKLALGIGLIGSMAFSACEKLQNKDGLTTMGMEYKIISRGSDSTIKDGNIVLLNLEVRNHKDSIIGPWRQIQQLIGAPDRSFPLRDGLFMLGEGDSAIFYQSTDSIFQGSEQGRPPFLPAGTKIAYHVKVAKRFKTPQEAMQSQKEKLLTWAKEHNLENVTEDENGILYAITSKKSTKANLPGDSIQVDYTGTFLTGKEFDSSVGRGPYGLKLGKGSVIQGWDLGLLHFGKGDEGYLLVPSDKAYGDGGGV